MLCTVHLSICLFQWWLFCVLVSYNSFACFHSCTELKDVYSCFIKWIKHSSSRSSNIRNGIWNFIRVILWTKNTYLLFIYFWLDSYYQLLHLIWTYYSLQNKEWCWSSQLIRDFIFTPLLHKQKICYFALIEHLGRIFVIIIGGLDIHWYTLIYQNQMCFIDSEEAQQNSTTTGHYNNQKMCSGY